MPARSVRVVFVCTGNICRSPTAEAIFAHLVAERGLADRIEVDSAGMAGDFADEPPDPNATLAAARRGIVMAHLRGRAFSPADFASFDLIIAMARGHERQLRALCPPQHAHKIRLFLSFAPEWGQDVPDPYGGGSDGFERVFDMIAAGAQGLLREVETRLE